MGLSLISSPVLRLCCCFFFFFYMLMLSQHHQASCRQLNGFHKHFNVAGHEDQGRSSYEDQLPPLPVLQSQLGRGSRFNGHFGVRDGAGSYGVQRPPPPPVSSPPPPPRRPPTPPPPEGRFGDKPKRSPPPPVPRDPIRD